MPDFNTMKKFAALKEEVAGSYGTFVQPTNVLYPINDVELPSPELNLNEYGRPAVGKFKRGRYASGSQTASISWTSSLMQPADWTTGIEISPIFEGAGWRSKQDNAGEDFYLEWNGNANCQTYSMEVAILGCYEDEANANSDLWQFRGLKHDLTISAEDVGAQMVIGVTSMGAIELHNEVHYDTTAITVGDFDDVFFDRYLGANVTLNGLDLDVQSFSFAQGNSTSARKDASAGLGTRKGDIRDADPKITITCVMGNNTSGIWNNTINNIPVGDVVVKGQVFTFTFENCTVSGYTPSDADGLEVLTLELSVSGNIYARKSV